ncbi:ABC transporter permease [Sphingomonas sp. IC-56]|uniref:ABC transporter permease n=1 Tax=Sphingomonas sp. IC-56 TaxID=2898529 RepID=UPI001E2A4D1F|nr:ABC transporter permease [Sphingomonas sp. IC-56]MCD2323369.1 ABC transporter permease [Sphingomonas sp. IC-56]
MLDAVRAEALKLRGHRATWMMVWVCPVVIAVVAIGILVYHMVSGPGAAVPMKPAGEWVRDSAVFWRFPASPPGRVLIAGFATLVFAGEYGWNTWKLIIPARSRWQLIAAKWIVAFGFVLAAYIAADLIGLLATWLQSFQGDKIPEGVTLAAVAQAHVRAAGHTLVPIAFTIALAGMFAILTQSMLATAILSIVIIILEGMLPLLAILAYARAPGLTEAVVEVLPLYHLINLGAGAKGILFMLPLAPPHMLTFSWAASMAVVLGWTAAAGAVTLLQFRRQDLN